MNSDQGLFNESIHVSTRVNDFRFHRELIDQRIEQMRKEDPALRKMSYDCIAEKMIGLSRTTFFRIRTGALDDPKSSTTWLLSSALDIPVCKLLGLPSHEAVHGNAAHELHMRDLERRTESQEKELDRLRKLLLAEGKEASAAKEQARSLENTIMSMRSEIVLLRRRRVMLLIMIAVLLLLATYFASEIADPHRGLTRLFM